MNRKMIKNNTRYLKNIKFADSIKILNEGLKAAEPESCLNPFFSKNRIKIKDSIIDLKTFDNVYIVAIGKASDLMARFVSKKVNFKHGIIVIPSNYKTVFSDKKIKTFKSGHPLPNKQSVKAALYLEDLVSRAGKNDFIIYLISGGGSALISHPMGISLDEKITVNNELIHSGASINEISCVRKHLSLIKGGKLMMQMKCKGISFVMSDVIGDDLGSISSGLTFADKTTFAESLRVLKKYKIHEKVSKNVISTLEMGVRNKIHETPKKPIIKNIVIANNYRSLLAMKKISLKLNYTVSVVSNLNFDVKIAAKKIKNVFEKSNKTCLVFGGEPTVNVFGNGRGGRNQELVLHLVNELKKNSDYVVASIGTDGIDGNTKFAGAILSSKNISVFDDYLKNNDSFSFYKKFGGLIKTGPTHTNVNDIGLLIKQTL